MQGPVNYHLWSIVPKMMKGPPDCQNPAQKYVYIYGGMTRPACRLLMMKAPTFVQKGAKGRRCRHILYGVDIFSLQTVAVKTGGSILNDVIRKSERWNWSWRLSGGGCNVNTDSCLKQQRQVKECIHFLLWAEWKISY